MIIGLIPKDFLLIKPLNQQKSNQVIKKMDQKQLFLVRRLALFTNQVKNKILKEVRALKKMMKMMKKKNNLKEIM